jgi:SAM-dependent methyltransferase
MPTSDSGVPVGEGATGAAGTFACVVDDHPRFHLDVLRWFAALTIVAGVDPGDLVVHVVGSARSDALDHLRNQGARVVGVERFDPRSPHCNKISGARRLAADGVSGLAVLCDTDVAILEDPRTLDIPPRSVASKSVDDPNPPIDVLAGVFAASGLDLPAVLPLSWDPEQSTVAGNGNGGLYLIPGPLLATVATAWESWARWLLDRPQLLGTWAVHVDQVAMALGLAAEGIDPTSLDVRWNTPVHMPARIPPDVSEPAVIHYHQEVDATGQIRLTGSASVDVRIDAANEAIDRVWHRAFPNATFWQWRYLTDPDLGSGVGSRGLPLLSKRRLLSMLLEAVRPESVLDVGCGDGEATRGLSLTGYTGIDLSAEAVRRAGRGRPDGEFLVGSLADHPRTAEMVLNLDVLIHDPDPAEYRRQVARLWQATERALVISGYEQPLQSASPMVHFHEPLSQTLERVAPEAEVYPLRDEHEITTFVVLNPPQVRHPRDFGPTTLSPLIRRHPDPIGLVAVRLRAWRTIGFYPDHAPRLWEYPVVGRILEELLAPGSRVLDVGAGVNPLVPYLADRGYVVDTVDPSPVRRSWPPTPEWNEWDFLDYAEVGLAHRSWNTTVGALPVRPAFDAAYSVSVIEHLQAAERRILISEIATRLRPGGILVVTVDLIRNRDDLWNRIRGEEVEEPSRHGTLQDVVREGSAAGLHMFRLETVRDWGDVPVDIGLVAMRKAGRWGSAPMVRRWADGRSALARIRLALSRGRAASTSPPAVHEHGGDGR